MLSMFRRLWTAPVLNRRARRVTTRKKLPKLGANFAPLEDRITPIVGAYDLAPVVSLGGGYDAVGQYGVSVDDPDTGLGGTGTLLTSFRHVLTAQHVAGATRSSGISTLFRMPHPNDPMKEVAIASPGARTNGVWGGDQDNIPNGKDLAVITLAELAPLTLQPFDIYTESDEQGQRLTIVGYGRPGTGSMPSLVPWDAKTAVRSDSGSEELQRIRILGNPTGGTFTLWLPNSPQNKVTIDWNATADQVAAKLQQLPGLGTTLFNIPEYGDIPPVHVAKVDAPGHPFNGSFEVGFTVVDTTLYSNFNVPTLVVQNDLIGGTVNIETILQGNTPNKKRIGNNDVSRAENSLVKIDFDNGSPAPEDDLYQDGTGLGGQEAGTISGDSGGPAFIDNKIAGVTARGGSGFGAITFFTRVSDHQDFINDILDDPYDLVLNMKTQPWGNDGDPDDIRVNAANGMIRIYIDNVLRYQDSLSLIKSVRIEGSDDAEVISVESLGQPIPITINANGGMDTIRVVGVAPGASLYVSGGADHDLVAVGAGFLNLKDHIHGNLSLTGGVGSGDDRIEFRDQNGGDVGAKYDLALASFNRTGISPISYSGFNEVGVYTGQKSSLVTVSGSLASDVDIAGGPLADTVELGNAAGDLSGLINNIDVDGGGGSDVLRFAFSGQQTGRQHRFQNGSYQHMNTAGTITYETVTYSDIYFVQLLAGTGSDTIDIRGNAAGTVLSVNGGGSSNTFRLGQGDLDALGGLIEVYGGTGFSTVTLDDTDEMTNKTFDLTETGVKRTGVNIGITSVSYLSLNTSDASNFFRIHGTPAYTVIDAGEGANSFHLSPTDKDLGKITRGLRLYGGSEYDQMIVEDGNSTGVGPYTLTGSSLDRAGFGGVDFSGMNWVSLRLGNSNDTVNINGTAAGTPVEIDGGLGNDRFVFNGKPNSNVYIDGDYGYDIVTWSPVLLPPNDPNSGFNFLNLTSIELFDD